MRTLRLIKGEIKRFKDTGSKQALFLFKLERGQIVAILIKNYFHHKSECLLCQKETCLNILH